LLDAKTTGVLHDVVVEQRHADLDAVRHAHLVGVVEIVVRKKELRVEVEHLVEARHVRRQ